MSFFFFFKQKTAYEMRISDWSSDVCSSDLLFRLVAFHPAALDQAEGDIFPDLQAVEEGGTLEQHAEFAQHLLALVGAEFHRVFAVDQDLALFGAQQAEHAFQHHRLAGARAADHHQTLAARYLEVAPVQHDFFSEAIGDALQSYFPVAMRRRVGYGKRG